MCRSSRLLAACVVLASSTARADSLPTFPARNVPETFFGTVVDDPYRDLENVKDPQVVAWMKAHATHARATLDSLPGYQGMKARIVELDSTVSAVIGAVERREGGHLFFTRRAADANTFKLYHRGPDGRERLLADPDSWQKETGRPHALNYFSPSPDGRYVAYGISAAGSEDAAIHVIETETLKRVSGPIDRAQYPNISWHPDSRSFFYLRQQELKPGMPATDRYQDGRSWRHTVGTEPAQDVAMPGRPCSRKCPFEPRTLPSSSRSPARGTPCSSSSRTSSASSSCTRPPSRRSASPARRGCGSAGSRDKATQFAVKGDDIYLLTHRDSPRFSVIRTSLGAPDMKKAATVIAASDEVVFEIAAARDGLYFESRDGAVKRLKRLAWSGGAPRRGQVPARGAGDLLERLPARRRRGGDPRPPGRAQPRSTWSTQPARPPIPACSRRDIRRAVRPRHRPRSR